MKLQKNIIISEPIGKQWGLPEYSCPSCLILLIRIAILSSDAGAAAFLNSETDFFYIVIKSKN